jgi:hypothetical protein
MRAEIVIKLPGVGGHFKNYGIVLVQGFPHPLLQVA